MFISVIIPTYNRKEYLKKTLHSLNNMDFNSRDFEIICVDDGSTDGTKEFLEEYCRGGSQTTPISFRYFVQPHSGASAARNLGIEQARGEIIAFTDSDCIVDKNWIKEIVKPLQKKRVARLVSREHTNQKIVAVSGKVISNREKVTPFTHQVINQGDTFASCNIACRKDALIKVGKFDENFRYGHEDTDMYFRMRNLGKIVYNPNGIVYHLPIPLSFMQFIKRIKISYRNECLLYNKYPEIYKSRSLLCSIIRVLGIRNFVKGAQEHIRWLCRNPFVYILYLVGLGLQRFYLFFLIAKGFDKSQNLK